LEQFQNTQKAFRMSINDSSGSQQGFPSLCSSGCGFFSSVDSQGLCSVCFKEKLKKESQTSKPETTSSSSQTPNSEAVQSSTTSTSTSSLSDISTVASHSASNNSSSDQSKCEAAVASSEEPGVSEAGKDEDEPGPAKKPKKSRCLSCKKKLGLTGFTCRCGGLYCSIHRYSDKHDCAFDYKAMGEKEISENNPVIVAAKVSKI